jgi:hypothetical protein
VQALVVEANQEVMSTNLGSFNAGQLQLLIDLLAAHLDRPTVETVLRANAAEKMKPRDLVEMMLGNPDERADKDYLMGLLVDTIGQMDADLARQVTVGLIVHLEEAEAAEALIEECVPEDDKTHTAWATVRALVLEAKSQPPQMWALRGRAGVQAGALFALKSRLVPVVLLKRAAAKMKAFVEPLHAARMLRDVLLRMEVPLLRVAANRSIKSASDGGLLRCVTAFARVAPHNMQLQATYALSEHMLPSALPPYLALATEGFSEEKKLLLDQGFDQVPYPKFGCVSPSCGCVSHGVDTTTLSWQWFALLWLCLRWW